MGRSYQESNDGWRIFDVLAIPEGLAEELDHEEEQRRQQRREERMAFECEAKPLPTKSNLVTGSCWEERFVGWGGSTLKVLSKKDVEEDIEAMDVRSQDADAKKRKASLHKLIAKRGEYRKLMKLPGDWSEQLDELKTTFPNFSDVVDYLRAMFVVAEMSDDSPSFDPMLLNGPPGVGKSLFAERLSGFFGSGFRRVNMETAQSNSQLAGSDEFWSNSKHGAIFELLVEGDWANPVVYIDEVDKASSGAQYNPLASLYGLLEPGTAKSFHDLSMPGIALDASHIYWILTCNSTDQIPEPILSRVRQFDVATPTSEQAASILQNIYRQLQLELKLALSMDPLTADMVTVLTEISPRRQKQLLREAIGRALLDGRSTLLIGDIRLPRDLVRTNKRIGF